MQRCVPEKLIPAFRLTGAVIELTLAHDPQCLKFLFITVKAPYNDHTGLQQFGHCSALLLKRYNDI